MSGWVGLEQLMTAEDVAEVLAVPSCRTVDRLRKEGQLRAVKVGRGYRFDRRDVQAFIESLRGNSTG